MQERFKWWHNYVTVCSCIILVFLGVCKGGINMYIFKFIFIQELYHNLLYSMLVIILSIGFTWKLLEELILPTLWTSEHSNKRLTKLRYLRKKKTPISTYLHPLHTHPVQSKVQLLAWSSHTMPLPPTPQTTVCTLSFTTPKTIPPLLPLKIEPLPNIFLNPVSQPTTGLFLIAPLFFLIILFLTCAPHLCQRSTDVKKIKNRTISLSYLLYCDLIHVWKIAEVRERIQVWFSRLSRLDYNPNYKQ